MTTITHGSIAPCPTCGFGGLGLDAANPEKLTCGQCQWETSTYFEAVRRAVDNHLAGEAKAGIEHAAEEAQLMEAFRDLEHASQMAYSTSDEQDAVQNKVSDACDTIADAPYRTALDAIERYEWSVGLARLEALKTVKGS